MTHATTEEVQIERPATKRVTFAEEPQIETISDYSSISSGSTAHPPFQPQTSVRYVQPIPQKTVSGYWYPTFLSPPPPTKRTLDHTERLIDQKLDQAMALDPDLFCSKEQVKKKGLFHKVVLKSKKLPLRRKTFKETV
ncbi:hypothetical protein BY458DRAFT_510630 [Sporodiniella umbellata]|nr:hypothetical protein BY458DRAFT_510630 [Sporodiniella umbellata]